MDRRLVCFLLLLASLFLKASAQEKIDRLTTKNESKSHDSSHKYVDYYDPFLHWQLS